MLDVLLTGFEPFGGHESNPSSAIAERLDRLELCGSRVHAVVLPVDGHSAPGRLIRAIDTLRPAAVLMLGLAEGRPQPALERIAVNALDYPMADNSGATRRNEAVFEAGPAAYFSSLPVTAILSRWREQQLPGYLSDTAGTYLCNQVFYTARHNLTTTGRADVPAGFLHLPCDERLGLVKPRPFVPLEIQERYVRAAIEETLASITAGTGRRTAVV